MVFARNVGVRMYHLASQSTKYQTNILVWFGYPLSNYRGSIRRTARTQLGGVSTYYSIFKTTRNGFFIGFPYMALGLLVSSYGCRLSKTKLFVLLIIGFVKVPLSHFITIYALFVLILGINLPTRKDDLYVNMRLSSSVIYFTHMLWVGLLSLVFPEILPIPLFVTAVILFGLAALFFIRYKEKGIVQLLFR